MRIRLSILLLSTLFFALNLEAQVSPAEIKYQAWDIHALRYYPFTTRADSIVAKTLDKRIEMPPYGYSQISADLVANRNYLNQRIAFSTMTNDLVNRFIVRPYRSWLDYSHVFNGNELGLNVGFFTKSDTGNSTRKSLFNFIGYDNLEYLLEETVGDIDLWKSNNAILFNGIKSPLDKKSFNDYIFFLSSVKEIDSVECYEIVFYSKELKKKALEGFLYISKNDYSLKKAVFTLNYSLNKGRIKEALFIQTPQKKETQLFLGDETDGSLVLSKTNLFSEKPWKNSELPINLTPAQKNLDKLLEEAGNTRAYRNVEKALSFLLTEHIPMGNLNVGPVLQFISYNKMEGLRLRFGGNTSVRFNPKFSLGGYVAYGFKDEILKYRGDINYTPRVTDKLSITYVNDLNLPGYELTSSRRDNIFYSMAHSGTDNMSLQKLGQINYEKKVSDSFSFKAGARYLFDQPKGSIRYVQNIGGSERIISDITSSELNLSIRMAPGEKFIRTGDRKLNFQSADFVLQIDHRLGLKDIFQSDYRYNATELSVFKKMDLSAKTGSVAFRASAGKIWDRVPFPLLFIPAGNQSYIFDRNEYNLMKFYEFVTDNYIAGNINLELNWSPVKLIFPSSSIKTAIGAKTIYGPLSDDNNPEIHPELFALNGVRALGNQPYTELNIGLLNILKILRFDYVYRLNYGKKGGFFFSSAYIF